MDVWALLSDQQNREVLSWLGGGLVVVAGGAWTMIKFFSSPKAPSTPGATASSRRAASRDGIAAGRDVTFSTRHGLTGWQPVLLVLAAAGAVLLAATFAGNRVTATGGSVAIGSDVSGDVTIGVPPGPADR